MQPCPTRSKRRARTRLLTLAVAFVAVSFAASSCGTDADTVAAQLETARVAHASELDAVLSSAADERAEAEAALREEIEGLTASVEESERLRADEAEELAAAKTENNRVAALLSASERDLAAAEERASELESKYDTEIRAEAQNLWEVEVERACAEAGDGVLAVSNFVRYTDQLKPIGTEKELVELVTECAEPIRSRSEAQRLDADCEQGSPDQVTRDPSALAGTCYVVYLIPWQWDSRTGKCNFLANWEGTNLGTRRFDYDGDGIFRAPDEVCDRDLSDADQQDLLKVWATLTGSYRYDTAAGGTNEIPDFTIQKAELVAKA